MQKCVDHAAGCWRPALLVAGLAFAFAAAGQAPDQEPRLETIALPQQPVQNAAAQPQALETVVISATRTGDTLAKTATSVTVVRELDLRQTNISDLEALSDRLPNAQLALTPTNTFLFVRGLGTGSVRSAEQSVGFFVDGVFLGRPQAALFDFLDLKQVELLRGPQGALLGKNTVAGAVNIKTAAPTSEPEGFAELLTGSDGQRRARAALSGPVTDTLSARIAYSETDDDGVLYNTTQQRRDLAQPGRAARIKLSWQPLEEAQFEALVQSTRLRQTGDSFQLSQASEQTLALYRRYDPETSTDINDHRTHTDHRQSGALIEGEDVILTADWSPAFGRLRAIVNVSGQDAVTDFDLDISPAPLLSFPSIEHYRQRSVELRFDDRYGWGDISTGLYYFGSDLDLGVDAVAFANGVDGFVGPLIDSNTGLPAGAAVSSALDLLAAALPQGSPFDPAALGIGRSRHTLVQEQATVSAFGTARWNLSRRYSLRLDARLTREAKRGDQQIVFDGVTGPLLGQALGEEEYTLQARRREVDFSPRLSLLAQFARSFSGYLTVGQGFKSGGFNNLAAVPERAEFDGEHSTTYEAGLRLGSWRGLSGSLGLFYTDFDNLQVASLDGTEFFVGNAAKAHTQGLELSLTWKLLGGALTLGTDLGYLDAQYDRYENAPATAASGDDSQDLSGRVLQRAPRFSGNLRLDTLSRLPLLELPVGFGVVAEGASHQFLSVDLDPIDSQPGYLRYNAYAGISDRSGKLSLRLIGRNLSDKTVRREAGDVAIVGAHFVGLYPPRSLAAELGYRF